MLTPHGEIQINIETSAFVEANDQSNASSDDPYFSSLSGSDHHSGNEVASSADLSLSPLSPVSITSTMVAMIDESLELNTRPSDLPSTHKGQYWHFSEAHFEILGRFRDRTALTIGDKRLVQGYRDCLCQLALTVRSENPSLRRVYSNDPTVSIPNAHAAWLDTNA